MRLRRFEQVEDDVLDMVAFLNCVMTTITTRNKLLPRYHSVTFKAKYQSEQIVVLVTFRRLPLVMNVCQIFVWNF